jgi:SAM-dependent methyltransferase
MIRNLLRRLAGPAPTLPPLDPGMSLRDTVMRGWFNRETGELFTNFPVGPDDVVADIGCGDGGHARFCASMGARVILADIDPVALEEATKRVAAEPACPGYESHLTDSHPLPIASGSVSRVICTDVIEHVDAPEHLMAELARIGKPGALYLIACPAPGSEDIQKRLAAASYFEKPNHLRIISPGELDRYVTDAGLTVEGRYSFGFYWSIWWALFWAAGVPFDRPEHPLLESWARTWQILLDQPNGPAVKHALDDLQPKTQMVIARKG